MPVRRRRPKFVQHIPESAIAPMFSVVERIPGANFWHAVIRDAIVGDYPEFRYAVPKKGCPFTIQELANAVAGELNEGRGIITLQEFTDNIPTFLATFAANGRQVLCIMSTDHTRVAVVDTKPAVEWLKSKQQPGTKTIAVNSIL